MSRIGDCLYFAPGIPFSALDLRYGGLPNQLHRRIDGFYLRPAEELAASRNDFASGLLVVCAADALGWFMTGASASTDRMVGFFRRVPGLEDKHTAEIFCDHFRHGLVHEARVKNGSEFSLDAQLVTELRGDRLAVNPLLLASCVRRLLDEYCGHLNAHPDDLLTLTRRIKRRFRYEIADS